MTDISAIVLAAGEGIRLRPLTANRPKPMLPAATTPIIEHVFDELLAAGVTELAVVVGYGRERVQSHFGPTYRNVPITYVVQEKQLGSGHALLAAEDAVSRSGTTLVVNGDQLVDRRIIADVIETHDAEADATLGLIRQADVSHYGGVILEDGHITEIVENPSDERTYRLNAGVYALEPSAFDAAREVDPDDGERSLVEAIAELIDSEAIVRGVVSEGLWVDATYPWDLLRVADSLFAAGTVPEREIADSARIHESATLLEPVVIAEDAVVGPGAVVGPNACVGENATIGSSAVCEHSVVDADTRVGANATLVDCVTGRGVRVGAGSTVGGGPGDVHVGDRIHQDEPLGALLADHATDEGGVTYAPGTIVGSAARIHAGATVRGTIEDETEVQG